MPILAVGGVLLSIACSACADSSGTPHAGGTPVPGPSHGVAGNSHLVTPVPGQSPVAGLTDVVTTTSLGADGSPGATTTQFDRAVPRVYVVAVLNGLPAGSKLSYVRYLDGHYIDSRSANVGAGAKFFHFIFEANPGKHLLAGHYLLRVYVDEHAVRETSYTIGT